MYCKIIDSIDECPDGYTVVVRTHGVEKSVIDDIENNGGGGRPVISFDDWYNGWRETWEDKEQYETADLAKKLGVPFDRDSWYGDYAYREQIKHDLYNAWISNIVDEVNANKNLNPDVGNIDETTGENIVFGNANDGTETEIE